MVFDLNSPDYCPEKNNIQINLNKHGWNMMTDADERVLEFIWKDREGTSDQKRLWSNPLHSHWQE